MAETTLEKAFADVWKALDLKEQRKAMRGAMRKEATRVRKMAVSVIRTKRLGQGTRRDITKGVWQKVYPARYGLGFMVSVKATKSKRGQHINRQGLMKPVLMWAAEGTRNRNVGARKADGGRVSWTGRRYQGYKRTGHSTGKMPAYHFMEQTETMAAPGVENNLWKNFEDNVNKAIANSR